jgi:hypothetical protein
MSGAIYFTRVEILCFEPSVIILIMMMMLMMLQLLGQKRASFTEIHSSQTQFS